MRAKACIRCRQWKARCDIPPDEPEGCIRCRSLNIPCVFDLTFKRVPKTKRSTKTKTVPQTSSETQHPHSATDNSAIDNVSIPTPNSTMSSYIQQAHQEAMFGSDWTSNFNGNTESAAIPTSTALAAPHTEQSISPPLFSIDDVTLTVAQANEHFRRYFAWFHQHLPFEMASQLPEEIYSRSPLLFWTICATTSSWKLQARLSHSVKNMVKDTIYARRSIETIQALLILCVWPSTIYSLNDDPSHVHSGLATQMCLQLGLHRPAQSYPPHLAACSSIEVRLTTWLAAYVVGQMQSSILGVPPPVNMDSQLSNAFEHPTVPENLSQLCRIHQLLSQASLDLTSNNPSPSGLLDGSTRLNMLKLYGENFRRLREKHLDDISDGIKIAFLHARVRLWSFALLDDMPISSELLNIVEQAVEDACSVIDICYRLNLSISPYYIRRAMCYCAFVLVKILRSPYNMQAEVLEDHIESVCQALTTSACSINDLDYKACQALRGLPHMEDKKLSPPIVSRMEASMFYDLLRIWSENNFGRATTLDQNLDILHFDINDFDWSTLGIGAEIVDTDFNLSFHSL